MIDHPAEQTTPPYCQRPLYRSRTTGNRTPKRPLGANGLNRSRGRVVLIRGLPVDEV